jgi:peptidoglycan/xylan/chitin deacetylase (PgdA/CDA1 family)
MKRGIIRVASQIAHATGVAVVLGRGHAGVGCIFMLHDVVATQQELVDPYVQTSVEFLDLVLRYFESRGIAVVSLDEAVERLERRHEEPFVCFTFDDGFRSNLTLALPLFRKHRKPFAVYVTTGFLDRRIAYWWGALRQVIRQSEEIVLPKPGIRFSTAGRASKVRAFQKICRLVSRGGLAIEDVESFCRRANVGPDQAMAADALGSAELKLLSEDPLVEIGGHTDSHRALSGLSAAEVRTDIQKGRLLLETIIQKQVRHFAYPFGTAGACGEREFTICRELGFRTAVTTRPGNLHRAHVDQMVALPRNRFDGGCEGLGFIECQRNGAAAAVQAVWKTIA